MRLVTVGSADAFNAAGRGHSCLWVEGLADEPVMVDFGATALAGLRRFALDPVRLGGVLVTHLHGDHVGGAPFLWIDMLFHPRRTGPLAWLGPRGMEESVRGLVRACYGEVADEEPDAGVRFEEIAPGQHTTWRGMRVAAHEARHGSTAGGALAYRVEGAGGRTLAVTGDTAMDDDLLGALGPADVLVAECSSLANEGGKHCSWEEWAPRLAGLPFGRIVLTHLGADVRAKAGELRGAVPGAAFEFADDGLELTI